MAELTLGQKQRLFSKLVGRLLTRVYSQGYECSLGECTRSDEQAVINSYGESGRYLLAVAIELAFPALAIAISNNVGSGILLSAHRNKLAIDLNLFKDGIYLTETSSHKPFGDWWKTLHPDCRWGGDFRDGNHYSMIWQGRA